MLVIQSKKYHAKKANKTAGKMVNQYNSDSDEEEGMQDNNNDDERNVEIVTSMTFLNDPVVIELLTRIINLVEFFCRQAVENT